MKACIKLAQVGLAQVGLAQVGLIVVVLLMAIVPTTFAVESKDVVGKWGLDEEKSKSATDGNTAGLMKDVSINDNGTFEAMYGTKGTWKVEGGKVLVTFENSFRQNEEAVIDGTHLKFPSPAMAGKFCYLKKK